MKRKQGNEWQPASKSRTRARKRIKSVDKPTVAVDFDSVITGRERMAVFSKNGPRSPNVAKFLKELQTVATVIVCKSQVSPRATGQVYSEDLGRTIEGWLRAWNLCFDGVWIGEGKPVAAVYVDDRVASIPLNPNKADFEDTLVRVRGLLER